LKERYAFENNNENIHKKKKINKKIFEIKTSRMLFQFDKKRGI
jgi:hypothetical protein